MLPELELMVTDFSGHVSDAEFRARFSEFYADPIYRPGFNGFSIVRDEAVLDFSIDCLNFIAGLTREYHGAQGTRTAIVVSNPLQGPIPKLYSAVTEIADEVEDARVFADPAGAAQWLNVPLDRLADRFPPGFLEPSYNAPDAENSTPSSSA